jgi:hypothetical protein
VLFQTLEELNVYLKNLGYDSKLLSLLPPGFKQKGQTCKLNALSAGLHLRYQSDPTTNPIPPYPAKFHIRKQHYIDNHHKFKSLRQQAKQLGSVAGEVYDVRDIIELARLNGFSGVYVKHYDSRKSYKEALISALDQQQAINIYYDVDPKTGLPVRTNSKTEHGAIAIGYALMPDKPTLIVLSTWDQYVAVNVDELYQSTIQLQPQRRPEVFVKFPGAFWQNAQPGIAEIPGAKYRKAKAPSEDALSFRAAIIYISEPIAMQKRPHHYINQGLEQISAASEHASALTDFPTEAEQFTKDTRIILKERPTKSYKQIRAELNTPKYIPLDVLVHFLEIANSFQEKLSNDQLHEFAQFFELNDHIRRLCLIENQTELSGSLMDDIYRQNPDSRRSIVELISNSMDADARRVVVDIDDGSFAVTDNGCGMTADILFNKLFIPKSSSKLVIADSIGRFGVGFYTSLSHLKSENTMVVLQTHSVKERDGYQITFRYNAGRIEVSIETNQEIPIGTKITVKDGQIKTTDYVAYAKSYFATYQGEGLFINGEAVKLSDNYEIYPTATAVALINRLDNESPSIKITLSNVLITELKLTRKSNAYNVIWCLPKDTTITESRDAVQVDSLALIHTIKELIDVVYVLAETERLAYLNTVSVAVLELQNRNSFYGAENNVLHYLMRTLTRVISAPLMVPDDRTFDFLAAGDCVRVHPSIIPENWLDNLAFQPKEWISHQVTTFVVKEMAKDKNIHFDDINQTLYITEALYLNAQKNPSQLTQLTKMLLRDNAGEWQFTKYEPERHRTADIYNFSDYSAPEHHALYLRHGGLTHVASSILDKLSQEQRAIIQEANTLVAKYPFKGKLNREYYWNRENTFDNKYGRYQPFEHQGVRYFVCSQQWKRWESTVVYDEHFHPISGKRAELILTLFRDSTEVIAPNAAMVDKVIMKKGDSTQLVSLETGAVVLDKLSIFSYYQAIPGSDYYIIRSKDTTAEYTENGSEPVLDRELTNYIYNNKNQCIKQYRGGKITVLPWQDFYLVIFYGCEGFANFYAAVDLYGKNFNSLSSTRIDHFYGHILPKSTQSYTFNNETLIVIKNQSKAEILKLNGNTIEHFSTARLVGKNLDGLIIDDQLYHIASGNLTLLGRVHLIKHHDMCSYHTRQDMDTITTTFVVYETNDAQIKLLTPDGQHWLLPKTINYQAFTSCTNNHKWLSIKQGTGYILLSNEPSDAPIVCENLVLAESSLDNFALINGQRLINSKDLEVFHTKDKMTITSHPSCPYLVIKIIAEKRTDLILDSNGNLLFPASLKYAEFVDDKNGWRISAGVGDNKFYLTANGTIVTQGSTHWCFEDSFPYLFYPEQAMRFYPGDITKITTNTYLVPGAPNSFYKQLPDTLLGDKDVLANLNYLNQRDLNTQDYSNALRFVDCPHEVFVAFYPFLSLLTYTPTKQQFRVYYEFYNLVFAENRAFLKKAIRLIDLIYFAAGNNSDIDLGSKIIDIVKLYGIGVLSQLYDVYSKIHLELYRVLSVDNELNQFLAPLPKKLRELSYYLFSQQMSLFNDKPLELISESSHFTNYCSLLDVITVAGLRTHDLAKLQAPEELFSFLSQFDKPIDKELAKRKLIHATYHLCDASSPNYLREMMQNSMDASAKGMSIKLDLCKTPNGRHLTRVEDKGCGMDLYTILHSLVIPGNSTKRGHKEFIGGRGVGFFSAFHGAESITLKTSKGNGITCYFNLIPVYDEHGERIIDVKLSGRTAQEEFTGTLIERISKADNGMLEAARTLNAVRQFGRFVDAERYKILLNDNQINESLDYIGEINVASIGPCKIYSNAECVFTSGGLFIKNIDVDYWDTIPHFITDRLKALGIVIELPSSIALTRERNNFYAADKFKEYFKPLFFQLCLNAYCNLLKQGKIEANYLPDDLFNNLRKGHSWLSPIEQEIVADAEKVNCGQLFENYARYLSNDNCVFLLTHIKFINYGTILVSLNDIANLSQSSRVSMDLLPHFVRWRLEREEQSIKFESTYEQELNKTNNEYEQRLLKYKYCSWTVDYQGAFNNAPNWAIFYKLCTQIVAVVAKQYGFELTIKFSTQSPSALAFVMPAEFSKVVKDGRQIKQASIFINPFNWQRQVTALCSDETPSENIRALIDKLVETLSHEIAHIEEESFCHSGVRSVTHNESFRALNANIFADIMLLLDTEALVKQTSAEIKPLRQSSDKVKLPNAKELMIMQLLNKPNYLEYLKALKKSVAPTSDDEVSLPSPR